MALMNCPECNGMISNKAYSCPHCGYPLQEISFAPKAKPKTRKKRPNGSGTIVKLSGKRRNPFQVRVNTKLNDFGFPVYDVLGNYPDRVSADIALANYNKNPYDPEERKKTFAEVFYSWYQWKYNIPFTAKGKNSSQNCTAAAFKKCSALHNMAMWNIRTQDMQEILNNDDFSHATLEHIKNLLKQMYKYSLQYEFAEKDYSKFLIIPKADDDEHGIPFTQEELKKLWENIDKPFVDTILILCYTGFRINELATMPLQNINLQERTFTGGLKTRYSINRVVPMHPAIYKLVTERYNEQFKSILYHNNSQDITQQKYRKYFSEALICCGINNKHTPHDCRHTFNTLLDEAGVDRVTRYKLMGHKGADINENIYTHKNTEQLRKAIEMIQVKP